MTRPGPLAGVRVVEIDAIGPLPLAAMMLADMGADVVRLTRPGGAPGPWEDVGGAILHRGRAAVALDLKTQAADALELIARADILVEGMRPGAMERLGLGPEPCHRANPALVYGRITGWGQDGPLAPRAGHDINFIAQSGVLHAIGGRGEIPPVPLNIVGDYGAGTMLLLTGVLGALVEARTSGRGRVVDAAIIDGLAAQTSLFRAFLGNGQWLPERASNLLDGAAPYYRCYRCADGRFLAVGALEPQFFRAFLEGLDLAFEDFPQNDRSLWEDQSAAIGAVIAGCPRDEWVKRFAGLDACVSAVLDWEEAANDPHAVARELFHRKQGTWHPAPAPRFSGGKVEPGPALQSTLAAALERWSRPAAKECS